ncbi:MAG: potassium channel family protein [Gammaproteobacteria bacterium]|nr:potassium channel family protein [Gammaproteobacteria bacterium]
MLPPSYWLAGLITILIVIVCVLVHYEGLRLLSDRLPTPRLHQRQRVILLILSLLFLHIVEIWIFGLAYYGLLTLGNFGELQGVSGNLLYDCVYFSASAYTTIGFGDIYPVGALRTMTGAEGITGLTIITWSASYTFVEMLKTWDSNE